MAAPREVVVASPYLQDVLDDIAQDAAVRREQAAFDAPAPLAEGAEHPWIVGLTHLGLNAPGEEGAEDRFRPRVLVEQLEARPHALAYGAGMTYNLVNHVLVSDPLVTKVRLMGTELYPFAQGYNSTRIGTFAYIFATLRCTVSGNRSVSMKIAVCVGEAFAAHIPARMIDDRNTSRAAVALIVQDSLRDNLPSIETLCNPRAETYAEFITSDVITALYPGAVNFAAWPPTAAEIGAITPVSAMKILYYLTTCIRRDPRSLNIELLAHAFISLAKRGSLTENVIDRVIQGLNDEFQVNITLDAEACNTIYKQFLSGVNETNVANVLATYLNILPMIALRFRLLLTQAAFAGLTCFTCIGRALRLYPTFYWATMDVLLPGQLTNFAIARARVGGNAYYGFRNDLGPVKSTKYKALAFVSIQLLVRLAGDRSLTRFKGTTRTTPIPAKQRILDLIDDYVDHYFDEPEDDNIPRARFARENFHANEVRYYDFCMSIVEDIFN